MHNALNAITKSKNSAATPTKPSDPNDESLISPKLQRKSINNNSSNNDSILSNNNGSKSAAANVNVISPSLSSSSQPSAQSPTQPQNTKPKQSTTQNNLKFKQNEPGPPVTNYTRPINEATKFDSLEVTFFFVLFFLFYDKSFF